MARSIRHSLPSVSAAASIPNRSPKVPSMHNHTRSNLFKLLIASSCALAHIAGLQVSSASAIPNYTDPTTYPATWPTWYPYKINGSNLSDSSGDSTNGGTQPQASANISPCPNQTASVYFARDSNNLYFRLCLASDPYQSSNGPYDATTTWSILLDVTGDGYRDFVVMLDGKSGSAYDKAPDNLYVLYKNDKRQDFVDADIQTGSGGGATVGPSVLWVQDSAKGTIPNTIDGETGWDVLSQDYKRTRITANGDGTYFLDIQVPLTALDAGTGKPKITATTPISFAYGTANSNTNPIQKDFAAPGTFTVDPAQPIPFGDTVGGNGITYDQPSIPTITNSGTCAAVSLSALVQDSLRYNGTTFTSSVGGVKFYYQRAIGGATVPNSGGTWNLIGDGTISSTDSGLWNFAGWNTSTLLQGTYFIKAVATDMGADVTAATTADNNTTDSIDIVDAVGVNNTPTPTGGDTYNPATNGTTAVYTSVDNTSCGSLGPTISGKVFEDINYGGGTGRDYTAANISATNSGWTTGAIGSGSSTPATSTVVELYKDNAGTITKVQEKTTDDTGSYSFTGLSGGTYRVRVVNSTVRSERAGYTYTTHLPIQTYRYDPDATIPAITNEVGGRSSTGEDVGTQSIESAFPSTAQSWTDLVVGSTTISGVDFGFNFDTIVNTNNSGQGSLRQFIDNSNTLANTNLNQDPNPIPVSGTTAIDPALGDETSIFMIPTAQLTAAGVANFNITSLLPQITGTNANNTIIDGRTQTVNIGNTNIGTLGAATISKVGVDQLTLDPVNRPEIQITGLSTLAAGLDIQANNIRVEGIAILKFGAVGSSTNANINIGATFTNPIIKGNVIGTTATSFTDAGAGNRSNAYGIFSRATGGTYENNLIGFHGVGGLELNDVTSTVLIKNNEIRGNAIDNSNAEGTNILGGGGATVTGNLFIANGGPGIDTSGSSGNNTYTNNTITGNGIRTPSGQTAGMRILGTNTLIDRNLIYDNYGAGILVRDTSSTTNVKITKNSIYGNGAGDPTGHIGIDLVKTIASDPDSTLKNNVGDKVSLNDISDADTGGNGVLNFPILESARMSGTNLVVKGFAPAGAAIELFISDDDPSKFGEGKTYLTTVTEGATADGDSTTGSYGPAAINGVAQGTETTAQRFSFTIPLTSLAANPTGKNLTATATVGTTTSEFSGVVAAAANNPQLVLVKRVTAIGSTAITTTIDDTRLTATATNDNNSNWPAPLDPSGISNILKGSLTTSKVLPNQEIEYTIYFLSAGNVPIKMVNICDLIPPKTTYVTGSAKISFNGAGTTPLSGEFIAAGAVSNTTKPGIGLCKSTVANPQTTTNLSATDNPNGLVWVQVDTSRTPATALAAGEYGYIRFRVLSNPNNP